MAFFIDVLTLEELKSAYRKLVLLYHPDRGGDNEKMKRLNYEYARRLRTLEKKPSGFHDLCIGHTIMVNNSKSVVCEIGEDYFKARSLKTGREAYFSKSTGYAMLNFKLKARVV